MAIRQLVRARSVRPVRYSFSQPSELEADHAAGELAGTSAAQGLSDHGRSRMSVSGPAVLTPEPETETVRPRRMTLNMGPQHPSTHGVLRLELELDGETIVKAQPDIGYLHTGIEKQCEALTYQQVVTLTDRVDYLAPLSN